MPHKPSPASSQVTFVSCNLTNDQKPVLKQWAERNEDDLIKHMAACVAGGYRISIKEEKNGFTANMAQMRENGHNKGRILQEWGSSPERTLIKLIWAHLEFFTGTWPEGRAEPIDDW